MKHLDISHSIGLATEYLFHELKILFILGLSRTLNNLELHGEKEENLDSL